MPEHGRSGQSVPPPKATRLQRFLDTEGLRSAWLEEATGISRSEMRRIRAGRKVREDTMLRILRGARKITGRRVQITELFDLDPDDADSVPHSSEV
jgi:hypothetical protein